MEVRGERRSNNASQSTFELQKKKMRKPHWILRVKNRGRDVAERQCLANCVSLEHNTTHTLGLRFQIWRNQQEQKKTERKTAGAEWKPIEIEAGVYISAL
jgi:hypothetical protein